MKIRNLKEALERSWCKETAYQKTQAEWSEENKAYGQCAVTAVIVQEHFGGEILKGEITGEQYTHYWNKLPDGKEVDLTKSQFGPNKLKVSKIQVVSSEKLMKSEEFKKRYQLLKKRVES